MTVSHERWVAAPSSDSDSDSDSRKHRWAMRFHRWRTLPQTCSSALLHVALEQKYVAGRQLTRALGNSSLQSATCPHNQILHMLPWHLGPICHFLVCISLGHANNLLLTRPVDRSTRLTHGIFRPAAHEGARHQDLKSASLRNSEGNNKSSVRLLRRALGIRTSTRRMVRDFKGASRFSPFKTSATIPRGGRLLSEE